MSKLDLDLFGHEASPGPPEGGWLTASCSFESHRWQLEIEEGRARVTCVDPCPNPEHYDPHGPIPTCHCPWESDDYNTPEPIPVKITYVDDSSSGGPWGPAEYGFWLEVHPLAFPLARRLGF